jgi:hypothetical protein
MTAEHKAIQKNYTQVTRDLHNVKRRQEVSSRAMLFEYQSLLSQSASHQDNVTQASFRIRELEIDITN